MALRRMALDPEELTDGDGRLMLRGVGIGVSFVVDVLAPNDPPSSLKRAACALSGRSLRLQTRNFGSA